MNFSLLPSTKKLSQGHERQHILGGTTGTAQTIAEMQKLVAKGKREKEVRKLVGRLIQNCQKKDYGCYANEIYLYCRDKIQYAFDPANVELIEMPSVILETGIADCDSIVVLLASMLENIGLPSRFVTIKADRSRPEEFSHIFLEAEIPGPKGRQWVAMDPTMVNKPMGWAPPAEFPRRVWPASTDPMPEDETMGCLECMGNPNLGSLGESWVPGVVNAERDYQNPVADYRETVYRGGPSGVGGQSALYGLAETEDPDIDRGTIGIIMGMIDGSVLIDLNRAKKTYKKNLETLASRRREIATMKDQSQKKKALQLWDQAQAQLKATGAKINKAVEDYNSVVDAIDTVSLGSVKPERATGLAIAPAIGYAALAAGVMAAAGFALIGLSEFLSAWRSSSENTRTTLDRLADIIKAGGGAVDKGANLVSAVTWAAIVGGIGYVGWELFKGRRGRGGGQTMTLKPVTGKVLA